MGPLSPYLLNKRYGPKHIRKDNKKTLKVCHEKHLLDIFMGRAYHETVSVAENIFGDVEHEHQA
jgi:hypothetical protein